MTRKKNKRDSRRKFPIWKYFFILTGIVFIFIIIAGLYVGKGIKNEKYGEFPGYPELRKIEQSQATEIFTSDGILMGRYYYENRNSISFNEIPEDLVNALVATEDARFYEHNGIDFQSLLRVFFKTILIGDKSSGGGSTITQQLVKNLYPRKGEGIVNVLGAKLREMVVAYRLEKLYTKDKIIQLYLNTVPFGENTFGVKNASQLYFAKAPKDLSLNQSAALVGMLKATNTYNPHKFPEKATQRRNTVLYLMTQNNYLPESVTDSLSQLPLNTNYNPVGHNEGLAPYFREFLRKQLKEWCASNKNSNGNNYNLYTDGLRVYTTIHSEAQKSAFKAVQKHMPVLQKQMNEEFERIEKTRKFRQVLEHKIQQLPGYEIGSEESTEKINKKRPMEVFTWDGPETVKMSAVDSIKHYLRLLQTGFVALDPENGNVLAWVGGISHKYLKYDHVLSERQMGSVFKPIVYAKALQNGMSPCDYFPNDSIVYKEFDNWTPANADRKYGGVYSLQGALVNSVNTISVQLLMETGIDSVIKLAKNMGMENELQKVPSLALGTANASVLDMARVYSVFSNDGHFVKPKFLQRIEDSEGNILEEFTSEENAKKVLNKKITEQMTMMLSNAIKRGTGKSLNNFYFSGDAAGKTGTTQNHSDGWFVGYTPNIVFSCWVGADYPGIHFKSINYGQGATTALPITGYFLENIQKTETLKKYLGVFEFSEIDTNQYNCVDYRDKAPGLFEKLFNKKLFEKKEGDEEKKGILKKIIDIFKKDENNN